MAITELIIAEFCDFFILELIFVTFEDKSLMLFLKYVSNVDSNICIWILIKTGYCNYLFINSYMASPSNDYFFPNEELNILDDVLPNNGT